jgi:hypothetical protein
VRDLRREEKNAKGWSLFPSLGNPLYKKEEDDNRPACPVRANLASN